MKKDIAKELKELKQLVMHQVKERLTTEEAAQYMGCEPRTMRDMAANGDIPHYKDPHGRVLRFRRADLDAWMDYVRIPSKQEMEEELARREVERRIGKYKTTYDNGRTNAVSRR